MQRRIKPRNKVICFSGIDGSGKSAHARRLFNELEAAGVKCQYKWLRYPHFLALLPLVFYEFRNLRGRRNSALPKDQRLIKSQIRANNLIATAWTLIIFVDSFFSMARNVYLPYLLSYTLILDRSIIDTLLDTAVNLKREELIFSVTGRLFLNLLPKHSAVFIFDVEESLAAARKGSLDEVNFSQKSALYKRLSQIYHWNVISTADPFPEVHNKVLRLAAG